MIESSAVGSVSLPATTNRRRIGYAPADSIVAILSDSARSVDLDAAGAMLERQVGLFTDYLSG